MDIAAGDKGLMTEPGGEMTNETKPVLCLTRLTPFRNICVFGQLEDGDRFLAFTLEPPWLHDEPHQSCIPAGVYDTEVCYSPTKGKVFRLNDEATEPRKAIEIHAGNVPSETRGCILVGQWCGQLTIERRVQPAVLNSEPVLDQLFEDYPQGFMLHINDKT